MVTAYLRDDKSKDFNAPAGGLILPGAEVERSLPGGHRRRTGRDAEHSPSSSHASRKTPLG